MPFPPSPEDRPDPSDQIPPVRARVTEQVARGDISTGVIVVTGGTEFVLDFVRNLPRPNLIVARVVLPHMVMPQFIEALSTNVELYRQRYGDLPGSPPVVSLAVDNPIVSAGTTPPASTTPATTSPSSEIAPSGAPSETNHFGASASGGTNTRNDTPVENSSPGQQSQPTGALRRHNPQEIYDELKIRDELLSGSYANAVMIGHGPYEFHFDFITNFYPQSAVSARVFMGAGHIWRMLDSLKQSWEQLRPRLGLPTQPPGPPGPGHPGSQHGPGNPSGPSRPFG